MSELRPIPTRYRGYRFRSRLEARWATFFQTLGAEWEYEHQGYDLGAGVGNYLPDFWLPGVGMYAEIKSQEFTPEELRRCGVLAVQSGCPVLLLVGTPRYTPYPALELCEESTGDCTWGHQQLVLPGKRAAHWTDYWLDDRYLESERRFFVCGGLEPGADLEVEFGYLGEHTEAAYEAARSARFEHGDSPTRSRVIV